MSPSPAGSLNNSSDCLTAPDDSDLSKSVSSPESDTIIIANINKSSPSPLTDPSSHRKPIMGLRDYLHALDRHKSIDNCFLSPSPDDRLYFYDEIKQLTNHLFKITAQAAPHTNGADSDDRVHDMNIQNLNTTASKSNPLEEGVEACDENNNKINDADGTRESSARSHPFSEIFKKFADAGSHVNDSINAPWPVTTRRTKFRINQMSSRDVPIVKTDRPAKLQKQKAVDACDTKIFDEHISRKSIFHDTQTRPDSNCIADLLESFEHDRHRMLQSHFRHKTFIDRMPNGSISFDCGQIGVEQRSINTIRSLFQLHAATGRNVKLIQAQIEAKNK